MLSVLLPLLAKVTKSESKSQRMDIHEMSKHCCHCWPKLQNLKANHNAISNEMKRLDVAIAGQSYKSRGISPLFYGNFPNFVFYVLLK